MQLETIRSSAIVESACLLVRSGGEVVGGLRANGPRSTANVWSASIFRTRSYGIQVVSVGKHASSDAAMRAMRKYLRDHKGAAMNGVSMSAVSQ